MKHFPAAAGWLLVAVIASAAEVNIYRDGWIDLNKNGRKDVYEDPTRPVAARVNDLLKRMSLEEKIGQLEQPPMMADSDKTLAGQLQHGGIGSFLDGGDMVETPALRNKLQHIAIEQSRLGIPLIFGYDVIHGFRTIFPIPLAQACAWEPELFERTDAIAAREAAAAGVDWTFAPMVDLARDPRWGRIAEGFGEDPWLGALDAAASVRGFQGNTVAGTNNVVACLKHYVGYGAAEGGRDYNTTEISEFTLRNFYLPQFRAGVDAGALTVMSAFNDLNGMPASANRHTLTDILRGEWKFPGFVVSDYNAVVELIDHGIAADDAEAARFALNAGVDMEMVSTTYADTLKQQIESGQVSEKVIDQAVRRVLAVKFEKGLFDRPYVDEARCQTAFLQPDAVALAREAAAKSCVLLRNRPGTAPVYYSRDKAAPGLLPLSKKTKRVLLIGPAADNADEMLGCWDGRGRAEDAVSLAAGIRAKLTTDAQLTVLPGCGFTPGKDEDMGMIQQAVAAVGNADVVIFALGEPRAWSGESKSRSDLNVTGEQGYMFDAVNLAAAEAHIPVVVVLFNGRPLTVLHIAAECGALLEAWQPGVQGGNAVADILFGDAEPAGRLTTTFPYDVGQVPLYYNHANTGRPGEGEYKGNYVDGMNMALFPFGFGLAFTTFEFGNVQVDSPRVNMGGTLTAHVQIKNIGQRAGTAVAELYIRDLACSVGARPVRELKGFKKIMLQPGDSRDVGFTLPARDLGCYDTKGNWVVEPGKYQVWISKDSASGEPADVELQK